MYIIPVQNYQNSIAIWDMSSRISSTIYLYICIQSLLKSKRFYVVLVININVFIFIKVTALSHL